MNLPSSSKSRQGIWWVAWLLAVTGLGLGVELTRIHLRLQFEPTHQSFCNLSASVNCDVVAKSGYSMLLGLPLSIWGIFVYMAAIVASVWGLRSNRRAAAAILWLLAVICVAGAVALAAISAFVLRTWCLLCMVTWAIDIGLFAVATVLVKGTGPKAALLELVDWLRSNTAKACGWGAIGAVAVGLAYRAYLHPGEALSQDARAASPLHATPLPSGKPAEGVDETGQPYVGAQQPKLIITEYSDYQCPHCARAHEQLRRLVEAYPEAIRVHYRHFPLDNDCNPKISRPFHIHACYYARLAVCAAALGKSWQGNDYLFAHGQDASSVAIEAFARAIETPVEILKACLATKADLLLRRDIAAGAKLDIDGTPTFIIQGETYTGELPAEVLSAFPL